MTLNPLSSTKQKGGLALYYPTQGLEWISHKKDETDFITTVPLETPAVPPPHGSLRSDIETVVTTMPRDTLNDKVEEAKGIFDQRRPLTWKYGRVKLKMKHRDAHVYIFPLWVKEYAARNAFESISEDVLGWWAKAQWQKGLVEKLGLDQVLSQGQGSTQDIDNSQYDDDSVDAAAFSSTKASAPQKKAQISFASRVGQGAATAITTPAVEVPPLLAYVQPTPTEANPQALIRRVDTAHSLLEISLYLAKQQSHQLSHEHKVHPTVIMEEQSRVSREDSLVAENVKIGTRTVIKASVIGANCEIGAYARITGCLLMDGVTVGDGVQLTGCIIGRRAKIESLWKAPVEAADGGKKAKKQQDDDEEGRTQLKECEVAPGFVVEAGTEAKGEKITAFEMVSTEDEEDQGVESQDE